jgi:hypothetical protein
MHAVLSAAQRLQAFKLHVAPLQGPLVPLLQQHGADQPRDGVVVREDAAENFPRPSVRLLVPSPT